MDSLERYAELTRSVGTRSSSFKKALKLASLLEIMDILYADFEDTRASGNALSEMTKFNELRGMDTKGNGTARGKFDG